jgi:hypothetical protein
MTARHYAPDIRSTTHRRSFAMNDREIHAETESESFSSGWKTALNDLRLYLTHFACQQAAPMTASGSVGGRTRDDVWAQPTGALGVPADPAPGDRIAASAGGWTTLSGTVQDVDPGIVTLLLEERAPGLALMAPAARATRSTRSCARTCSVTDAPAIARATSPPGRPGSASSSRRPEQDHRSWRRRR